MSIPGSATPLLLATTAAAAPAAYQVDRSLRFNSADSAYLNRTPSSAGSGTTWTLSGWVKRAGFFGTYTPILMSADTSQTTEVAFDTSNRLQFVDGPTKYRVTDAVFRDPSAWYHIVVTWDTTNSTVANRCRIYVNGTEQSYSTEATISENATTDINTTDIHYIGRQSNTYTNCYQAEIHFIDGQALAASDFGEYDSNNVWQPKEFSGSYGSGTDYLADLVMNGTLYSGTSLSNAFDGDTSTPAQLTNTSQNQTLTFTPTGGIAYSSSVEVFLYPTGNVAVTRYSVNGGSDQSFAAGDGYKTLLSGSGTFTSFVLKQGAQGNSVGFSAIRIDGTTILVQGTGFNSFYLPFNDNSSNATLGYDQKETVTLNPDGGMDVVTYTGSGSTQTISGLGFQPDLVWIKQRNATRYHVLFDTVRGANKRLISNVSHPETTQTDHLSAFTSDGFTVQTSANTNISSGSYVAWCWKAGGAASANSDGSISSQTSVSTDYGFSIVTYTGTGNAETVGHGLSAAPSLIIAKCRTESSMSWAIYSPEIGAGKKLYLNENIASTNTGNWNSTAPTSSVFSVGGDTESNRNGQDQVAYCWSEVSGFSKFGSYSGSGSSGKAVTTGFKPRYVLLKRTDSTGNWFIFDSARGTGKTVWADLSDAEDSNYSITMTANGFTVNGTASGMNASGGTYIYAAFADRPGNNFDVNNLVATAGADGTEGFDAVTYSGNGGTQKIGGPVYSDGVSAYVNSLGSEPATNLFDGNTSTSFYSSSTSGSGIKFVPPIAITGSIELYLRNGDTDNSTFSYSLDGGSTFTNLTTAGGSGSYVSIGSQTISTTNGIIVKHVTTAGTNAVNWRAIKVDGTVLLDGTGPGLKFQPDFLWIKRRNGNNAHALFDSIRGVTKALESSNTGAEKTNDPAIASFDSNGFTVNGTYNQTNASGGTFVAWAWNAGANSNKTYTVKVVSDSGNKYRFDDFGTSAVTLDLQEGSTYVFDQSDSSNAGHPIRFGTSANGTDYTTGVTHTGTPGSAGAKTTLVLGTGVSTLYYSCANHTGMGGQINTNSTAGASNFDGSIQSVVKANNTYGFSVVTYAGNSVNNSTIGHGLSAVPKLIITKNRSSAYNWITYNETLAATKVLGLDVSNGAFTPSGGYYSNVGSSTYQVVQGSANLTNLNNSGNNYVAYCWSEVSGFSKISSYTGTGSSGHSIATGFAAAFVMIKRTDSAGHWAMYDTARGDNYWIEANNADAEQSHSTMNLSFTSTGFTINGTDGNINASGGTYIYMAFAGTPDGSVIDSLIDTPTNYEASSGNNGGNYATWNPLSSSGVTLSNGNLDATNSNSATKIASSTIVPTAKCYWEVTVETPRTGAIGGIHGVNAQGGRPDQSGGAGIYLAGSGSGGGTYVNGTQTAADFSASAGDIIGFAFDPSTRGLIITRNGSSVGTLTAPDTGNLQPVSALNQNVAINVNFGQRPFTYTPPTGYKSLCTQNLPDPTIADGSDYFDAKLYTGNGTTASSTQAITGFSFSPDFLWAKVRTAVSGHSIYDTVRAITQRLSSSQTTIFNNEDIFESFDSNGFTVKGNSNPTNALNEAYIAWAWDAGTSTASNTDGSISANVRANQSAGFSIVKATISSSGTIGHGLNAKPHMVFRKRMDGTSDWYVAVDTGSVEGYLLLNSTAAITSQSQNFTTNTFDAAWLGNSGEEWINYTFAPVAGYSAFGSYTGNGSTTDGPFVYTGFRPRWILFKNASSSTYGWYLLDTARNEYNVAATYIFPDSNAAEGTASVSIVDFLSNGFKPRAQGEYVNKSGDTYIYAAFAEHPFKTSRAR